MDTPSSLKTSSPAHSSDEDSQSSAGSSSGSESSDDEFPVVSLRGSMAMFETPRSETSSRSPPRRSKRVSMPASFHNPPQSLSLVSTLTPAPQSKLRRCVSAQDGRQAQRDLSSPSRRSSLTRKSSRKYYRHCVAYCRAGTKHGDCSYMCNSYNACKFKSTGDDLPSMPQMLRFKVPELVGDVFFKFGVLLLNDTTGQKMTVIKQDCGDDNSHIVRVTLKKWIKGEGLPVKWKTLVKTLRDCDLISLAAEIEAKKINGICVIYCG